MTNLAKDIRDILHHTDAHKFDNVDSIASSEVVEHWRFIIDQIKVVIDRAEAEEIDEIKKLCRQVRSAEHIKYGSP